MVKTFSLLGRFPPLATCQGQRS